MQNSIAWIFVFFLFAGLTVLDPKPGYAQSLSGEELDACRLNNLAAEAFIQKVIPDPYCCETQGDRLFCLKWHLVSLSKLEEYYVSIYQKLSTALEPGSAEGLPKCSNQEAEGGTLSSAEAEVTACINKIKTTINNIDGKITQIPPDPGGYY